MKTKLVSVLIFLCYRDSEAEGTALWSFSASVWNVKPTVKSHADPFLWNLASFIVMGSLALPSNEADVI